MQKAVCDMEAIPKLASIISQMDEEDNVYGIVGQKDKLKEVKPKQYGIAQAHHY